MEPQATTTNEKPWHAAFPAPHSTADHISRETLLELLQDDKKRPMRDLLTIDLRRTDREVRIVITEIQDLGTKCILRRYKQRHY